MRDVLETLERWTAAGERAALATLAAVEGPGPVVVSLVLWAGLLALAGILVARRDMA